MNPHFIFNAMNSIQHFILNHKEEEALRYVSKFSKLIRLVLEYSVKGEITIKKEIEALKFYLEIEKSRFKNKFDYQIDIDDKIDVDYHKIPFMIIQPFVENSIWHGLMSKKEKGEIFIRLQQKKSYLVCTIEDNGIGRENAQKINSIDKKNHESLGLSITKGRLKTLNKEKKEDFNINITDLKDNNGNCTGTRVEIRILLNT